MPLKRQKSRPTLMNHFVFGEELLCSVKTKEKKVFLSLLFRWGQIVGEQNRKMMIPLAIKGKMLLVAVPNSMVKHSVEPILSFLLGKIHTTGDLFSNITFIKLRVQADVFPKRKKRFIKKKRETPEPSKERIEIEVQRLMAQGLSKELAEPCARTLCILELRG